MALKNDYQNIAYRSIKASNECRRIQEKSAFLSYHAFESTGASLSEHAGLTVGSNVSHRMKITNFQNASRNHCSTIEQEKIARIAVTLSNLRNKLLYPTYNNSTSTYNCPETIITQAQSNSLRNDVKNIIKIVDKII